MSTTVTVRMYNQENLGDCFLLKFANGRKRSFLLIDFGSYEGDNTDKEIEIAQSILATVKDSPLKIVLTHQHKDHYTGFLKADKVMEKLNIQELWLSYLDDPNRSESVSIREAMKKFWDKNGELTAALKKKFRQVPAVDKMLKAKAGLDLFAEMQTGGEAISKLIGWSKKKPRFLFPGDHFDMPDLSDGSVKVYVLGPPADEAHLRKMNPGKGEAVESFNAMSQLTDLHASARLIEDALYCHTSQNGVSSEIENFPFNKKFTSGAGKKLITKPLEDAYKGEPWRQIDHEWLCEMGRVSLYMDTLTNNSSLVLAFELVEQKKVLLFVGDAQIGNWKSWLEVKFDKTSVTAKDLLARTVLYKAGHHSSHNATLAESLDMMNTDELVIMIPVNQRISTNRNFAMLRSGMLMGYNRKSQGRVLRSDTVFHKAGTIKNYKFSFAKQVSDFKPAVRVVKSKKGKEHLYIEYDVV